MNIIFIISRISGFGLEDPGVMFQFLAGCIKLFVFSIASRPAMELNKLLIQWILSLLFVFVPEQVGIRTNNTVKFVQN